MELGLGTGICEWSDDYYQLLGFKPGNIEPSQEAGLSVVHPDDISKVAEAVKLALDQEKQVEIIHRVIWQDSSIHWILELIKTIKNNEGEPIRVTAIAIDITNQKQLASPFSAE
jgi:PAS domain S-box-containing protein